MLARERVMAAVAYQTPDCIPLRILPAAGGLYEHGAPLQELIQSCGHDFGALDDLQLPEPPPPDDFDSDGTYHAFKTDEWGTRWEYRIFGIWGHPVEWPLEEMDNLDAYTFPDPPSATGSELDEAKVGARKHREQYFHLSSGGSILERLMGLRRFEDVLMDIGQDTPQINRLADRLTEYSMRFVERALALDADGVSFGDDFGTQRALIFSPAVWRRFFKPRYQALLEPVKRAGKTAFLHSCGELTPILEDLAEIGFDVIWPQLPLYSPTELHQRCRDLGMAVELHPDRGELMQRGTPQEVESYVRRIVDEFDSANGGSWLYLEIDPNFPFENVEALFRTAQSLRE